MALKDIKEDLQKVDSEYAKRDHDKTVYDAWHQIDEKRQGNVLWQKAKNVLADKQLRLVFLAAMGVALAAIVGMIIIFYAQLQRSYFTEEKVTMEFSMPELAVSNRPVVITLEIDNANRAPLEDIEAFVSLGQYFVPDENQEFFASSGKGMGIISLDHVDTKSIETVSVSGVFVAPENEVEAISVDVKYSPKGRSRVYEQSLSTTTTITSSPLLVSIISEKQVVSGNIVEFTVSYENTSEEKIDNVSLEMVYPPGFSFLSASPRGVDTQTWDLGVLSSGEMGEIRIAGTARGNVGNVENINATLFVTSDDDRVKYSDGAHVYRIVEPPIRLTQESSGDVNGVIQADQSMNYTVSFENTSDISLRDAVLKVYIDGEAANFGLLNLPSGGFFDEGHREIIWRASDVPALSILNPGDRGDVSFRLGVKERLPIDLPEDKNFTITSIASIDSNDVPSAIRDNKNILSNAHVIKVAAKPLVEIMPTHKLGPLPPRVGLATTFSIELKAGSVNNDLHSAKIEGSLPSGLRFAPLGDTVDSQIEINDRTNTFTWNIGKIRSGAGVISDMQTASFDVILTPSSNDINRLPELLKGGTFSGEDPFTGQGFDIQVKRVTTQDATSGNFSDAAVAP